MKLMRRRSFTRWMTRAHPAVRGAFIQYWGINAPFGTPPPPVGWTLKTSSNEVVASGGGTTAAIDTTGADFLFVAVATFGSSAGGTPTLTDSKGNTWFALTVYSSDLAKNKLATYYSPNPTVGTGHTFTLGSGVSAITFGVLAFSGSQLAGPLDTQSGAGSSVGGNNGTVLMPTTNQDGDLLIGVHVNAGTTSTNDIGLTEVMDVDNGASWSIMMGYLVQTTAASVSVVYNGSGAQVGMLASFKAA